MEAVFDPSEYHCYPLWPQSSCYPFAHDASDADRLCLTVSCKKKVDRLMLLQPLRPGEQAIGEPQQLRNSVCLLYTSDAADE